MTPCSLVLSPRLISSLDWEQSLSQLEAWIRSIGILETGIRIELPIRRAGQEGWISDNPPIDDIDRLLQRVQECGCILGSLWIPIDLLQAEKSTGNEISLIDGWADLASYAGIPLARFALFHAESQLSPPVNDFLRNSIAYMNEMEVGVSLHISDAERPAFVSLIERPVGETQTRCGLDLYLPASQLELSPEMDNSPLTVTVALAESITAEAIRYHYERILAWRWEGVEAVIFEIT